MSSFDDQQLLREAFVSHQRGDLTKAADLYRKLIRRNPDNYDALHYLGIVEAAAGNNEEAKSLMARSLAGRPTSIQFIENYATVLFQSGDYKTALQTCHERLQIDGANASLLYISAVSLFKLGRPRESLEYFDKLLVYQPNNIVAINERGCALAEMKQYDLALASFEGALTLNPQYAEAYVNKGNAYSELQRFGEALVEYDKALALKPDLAEGWLGRGNACRENRMQSEALTAFQKALALNPKLAEAWLGQGNLFYNLKDYDRAFKDYDRAFTLKPDLKHAESSRLHAKQCLCDWSDYNDEVSRLLTALTTRKALGNPFLNLSLPLSAADQLECARRYIADHPSFPPYWLGERYTHDRIRVAYISSDLQDHPVARLIAEVFERHDRARFEMTAISLAPDQESAMRARIKAAFEHFVDARSLVDGQIADYIRQHEIDIVVDLNGLTDGGRLGVLARRPAPIQVNYLGYPGTMGSDDFDYVIGDETIIPDEQRSFYSEQVVWLPHSYQANDLQRRISERTPARRECGLPEKGFVFCSFNNTFKLTPELFDVWMRLLRNVEGSVLWLIEGNAASSENLRHEAERLGVAANRLVFAPRLPLADHLARHRLADIFLDTLPYNAHTTASDALWAGLPLVTCLGTTFAGRVAASLLRAAGLAELVASTLGDYEALVLKLARDPALLSSLKAKLAANRLACPLFDTQRFTRHLEAAYVTMWERYRRGQPPAHFAVDAIEQR